MRSNGLTASAYSPVADLEPAVADSMLAELKGDGVAAYTRPALGASTSGVDPDDRQGLERLYVDAAHADSVRERLATRDPLLAENDDLTWAQIVAGYDRPMPDRVGSWPAYEDLGPDDAEPARTERGGGNHDDDPGEFDDVENGTRRDDGDDGIEDDVPPAERFVPPTPPPLPRLEPYQQLAWVGLVGGPAVLLVAVLFSLSLPTLVSGLAVGGFVAGFVTLVATMRDRDDDIDPGSGAVV